MNLYITALGENNNTTATKAKKVGFWKQIQSDQYIKQPKTNLNYYMAYLSFSILYFVLTLT